MSDALFELRAWLRHRVKAGGPHQVHSPLVFRLLTEVLIPQKSYYAFHELNARRRQLLKDKTTLSVKDFGAGSRKNYPNNERRVSDLARHSVQNKRCAEALFHIVRDLQPKTALEVGTSLGLTSAYLAKANSECNWTTMEGATEISNYAKGVLNQLSVSNTKVETGNFDELIPAYCARTEKLDFAFIDGNHRYEPTMRYFRLLSELTHEKSVFIFDDIHWSSEMEKAWIEIQNSDRISVTIDFFHFGVVYFRSGIEKQHFILRLP